MVDEGPSPEDIERFDRDMAYCPDCGAEVWDQAEICPKCHAYLGGHTSSRLPIQRWFQHRWFLLIVFALLLAFALMWLNGWPAGF